MKCTMRRRPVGLFVAMLGASAALLLQAGCGTDVDDSSATEADVATAGLTPAGTPGGAATQAVVSFRRSCFGSWYITDPSNTAIVTTAGATGGCLDRVGNTVGEGQQWNGFCTTNVSNTNGWIGCTP